MKPPTSCRRHLHQINQRIYGKCCVPLSSSNAYRLILALGRLYLEMKKLWICTNRVLLSEFWGCHSTDAPGILRCLAGSLAYCIVLTALQCLRVPSVKTRILKALQRFWMEESITDSLSGSVMETVVLLASSRYMQCLNRALFDTEV